MTRACKWDLTGIDEWPASRYPVGMACPDSGNAADYITGGWRAKRPVWDAEKCKNCLFCWVYCPDSSILVSEQKMTGIDLDHCKGCGICAQECPYGALEMHLESEFSEEDA